MGKLFETFRHIDIGRQKCIHALNSLGVTTPDDANFDVIANNIPMRAEMIDPAKYNHMWERPSEWVDTDELLKNAPKLDGYTPVFLYLLMARDDNIDITLKPSTQTQYCDDAYYLSDGTFITEEDGTTVSHSWDTSKDIQTNLGYNLRYAICYGLDTKLAQMSGNSSHSYFGTDAQYGIGSCLLEVVINIPFVKNAMTVYIPLFKNTTTSYVERIHVLGENTPFLTIGSNSNQYYGLRELVYDTVGEMVITTQSLFKQYSSSIMNQLKFIIPNVTEIKSTSSTSDTIRCAYVYAPNLTKLSPTGSSSYGGIYTPVMYAPRLTTVNKSLTIGVESLQYFPMLLEQGLTTLSGSIRYLNHFVERNINPSLTIPSDGTGSTATFYNEYAETIENTSGLPGNALSGFVFPKLKTISNPELLNTASSVSIYYIVVGDGFKSSINLTKQTQVSPKTLVELMSKLADVRDEEETYTLTLGSKNLSRLNENEIAIATNKGWVVL